MSLFDQSAGEAERDRGVARVQVHADTFVRDMREIAVEISATRGQVTSDDLRRVAIDQAVEPHHPNAWGAIFRGKGWTCIGRRKSAKVSNHAREIRIWRYDAGGTEDR